jgi:hypothetical protein
MLRALGALGAVTALGVLAQGGAIAGAAKGGKDVAVIKAKANLKKEKIFFKGDDTVERGQQLEVRIRTNIEDVGPHTFSLVKKSALPKTKKELKGCFESGICGPIAVDWHEVEFSEENPEEFTVGRPKVKTGNKGWDTLGNFKREGDSIYLETRGDSFSQKVSAEKGSKLFYICAVHPEMQGKIKVED